MRQLSISVVLLTAGALSAQGDVARTAFGLWQDGPAPQQLCGGGPDYRVEFTPGGAVYVPALPDAPRLFPVRFAFASLRRGAGTLALGQSEAAPRAGGDHTACYDRAVGLVEHYELTAAGVEQSFVLERRPAGGGDLVVRQRLVSELVPAVTGDCSAGLRLWAPGGHGGVALGAAVAVDARGDHFGMSMHFDGTWLELRLDHAAVEAAAYPLVLDPPIGTVRTISSTDGDLAPDVAWDETTQRYLVVWQRRLSVTVSEIRGQLLDDRARNVGSLLAITTNNAVAINPTVASVGLRDRFCVVWQEAPSAFGPWDLFGRSVDAGSGGLSTTIPVSADSANDIDPDLGSDYGPEDEAVLVWHVEGTGIRTVGVTLPETGDPRTVSRRDVVVSAEVAHPVISKSGGISGVYVVAWDVSGANGTAIEAMAMSRNGSSLSNRVTVSSSLTLRLPRLQRPDVDGDGQAFMVVYEKEESVGAGAYDIYCRSLRWDGTDLIPTTNAIPVESDAGNDEITPAVGYMAGKFLVGFADAAGPFLDYDVILQELSFDGTPCGTRTQVRDVSSAYDAHPALAAQSSGGGSGDQALCVFSSVSNVPPIFATGVLAQLFEAYVSGSATSLGGACGNGGTTVATGVFAAGNSAFRLELQGADPAATGAVLLFGTPGPTIGCGSCAILDTTTSVSLPVSGRASGLTIPIPCALQRAAGAVFEAQWVTLPTSQSPCPLVPGLSASDRLQLTLGR